MFNTNKIVVKKTNVKLWNIHTKIHNFSNQTKYTDYYPLKL